MTELMGMTWDHPRGFDSIVAATEAYHKQTNRCRITWNKRSLKDFGDFPIELLVGQYDLIMIDHPFVGEARVKDLLRPIETVLPESFIQNQREAHIGPTYESYAFGGTHWALPIDAATQVSAYNSNQMSHSDIPSCWSDFIEIMSTSFRSNVLWPLCQTDAWCSFLTLAAQLGNDQEKSVFSSEGLSHDIALETMAMVSELTEKVPKECWHLNPIDALELMSKKKSRYAFSPLLFGYNNYSRQKGKPGQIEFVNALSLKGKNPVALLGGVGLAISSKCDHQNEVSDYLQFIMQNEVMNGPYFEAGGQPSTRSAWQSIDINRRTAGFFTNTLGSMENAYTRPSVAGFNVFQEKAAKILHKRLITQSGGDSHTVGTINEIYRNYCEGY